MLLGRKDTYEYDVFGNQKFRYIDANQSNFWEYTWDGDNRIIQAELKSAGALLRTVSFKYDPFGRRTEKSVTESGITIKHSYVYDGEDIVLEYVNNGASTSLVHYIHGPGIDEPLAMVRNDQPSYYHADGLGSIVATTDASGNIVQRYSYEAFGQLTASNPTFDNFYTYTGREYDRETGLYYYRARYYDAMEGRFISKDPIGFAGGDVNLYGYVWNNPVNWIDPWGLEGLLTSRETIIQNTKERVPWPDILQPKYPIQISQVTTLEEIDCYARFLIDTGIGKGVEIELLKIFHKQGKRFIPGVNYLMTASDLYRLNKCLEDACKE